MARFFLCGVAALLLAAGAAAPDALAEPAGKAAAREVPMADVHLHLHRDQDVQKLAQTLDKNKVRWAGGVDRTSFLAPDPESLRTLLGARYFPAGAMAEQTDFMQKGGADAVASDQSPEFQQMLARLEQAFQEGRIGGLGELVVNNMNSSAIPWYRRKIAVDAPANAALYALAAKYKGYVNIHMEADADSVVQLESVLQTHPGLTVVLAHCMKTAGTSLVRGLLEHHPNAYCDLSYRSSVMYAGREYAPGEVIHTRSSLDKDWAQLIEDFPDRFMLGSDKTEPRGSLDKIYAALRDGILANLSEPTMRKVAYENAVRLYGLDPGLQ